MELRTATLMLAQMRTEVEGIIAFLGHKGKQELLVSYGWGCDLDMDELYQDKPLSLSGLGDYITLSIRDGAFTLGDADLYIESADRTVQFVLCHESDVHVRAEDAAVAEEVGAAWAAKGHPYYQVLQSHERDTL